MSAPKPKVQRTWLYTIYDKFGGKVVGRQGPQWTWECACGDYPKWQIGRTFSEAVYDADQHSRAHTAERVADELDDHLRRVKTDTSGFFPPGHDRTVGYTAALGHAARLVREHLVKEAK